MQIVHLLLAVLAVAAFQHQMVQQAQPDKDMLVAVADSRAVAIMQAAAAVVQVLLAATEQMVQ